MPNLDKDFYLDKQGLRQLVNELETNIVASEYDTSVSYTVGQYCIYENNFYRCTTATTGTWDSTAWVKVIISDEIAQSSGASSVAQLEDVQLNNLSDNDLLIYDSNLTGGKLWKNSGLNFIIDLIYPVGSIYLSVTDSTVASVQSRFGGTWERISEGKALFGYSTTDSAFQTIGSGGGRKEINLQHKHTVDKHSHLMDTYTSGNNGNTGDCTLTINQIPAHSHTVGTRSSAYGQAWKANGASAVASGSAFTAIGRGGDTAWYTETDSKGGGKAHSHSLNNHSHKLEAYTQQSSPGTDNQLSTTQSILNPYITVYMYKRTA